MQSATMDDEVRRRSGAPAEGRRWRPVEGLREDIIGVSEDGNYLMYNKALAYPYYTASNQ
jgi:hypothetical protein